LKLLDCKSVLSVDQARREGARHGLEHLPSLTRLTNLELQYQLTDADIAEVCNCTTLLHLVLKGGDRVSNEGIQHISKLQKLVHLSLKKKSMVTDTGLPSICQLSSLKSLSIWGGVISDGGMVQIAKTLTNLQYICVGSALLTNKGIESLCSNVTGLREVSIFSFKFTNPVLQYLAPLPLASLELWFCQGISDEGMNIIAEMPRLTSLNLGHCSKVTCEGLQSLTKLSSLTNLNMVACSLTKLTPLSKMPNLRSFSFGSTTIHDEQIQQLVAVPKLSNLYIRESPITNQSLAHLATLKLKMLEFDSCHEISEEGLYKLAFSTSLIRLSVTTCKKIGADINKKIFPLVNILVK